MRKDRAQSELALQRARDQCLAAESTITDQAAEMQALQTTIDDLRQQYTTDTDGLKELLRLSLERERVLQELNLEAYDLLTMCGVRKV